MNSRKLSNAYQTANNGNNVGVNMPVDTGRTVNPVLDPLTILIGEEQHECVCSSAFLSGNSHVIDATLEPLRTGGQQLIIPLPGITIELWGVMMHILQSPNDVSGTDMDSLVAAATKFHQYGFDTGMSICDMHISHHYKKLSAYFVSDPILAVKSTDDLIEWALMVTNIPQLTGSKSAIVAYFRKALSPPLVGESHIGGLHFSEAQLFKLAPFIAKENLLASRYTHEEVLCPLFPKDYLFTLSEEYRDRRFDHSRHSMLPPQTSV